MLVLVYLLVKLLVSLYICYCKFIIYILDIDFSLLNVTVINTTSSSVTVRCTTTYTAMGRYCKITINGLTNMSPFNGNTATVSIIGLIPNTTYTYTASLVNISTGLPLTDTCITLEGNFMTLDLPPPIIASSTQTPIGM